MRIATIDCGTNTVLLLVADVARGVAPTLVEDQMAVTRLGQGLDQSGVLSQEAMDRTFAALTSHVARARALGAVHIAAVGTESLRAAKNGDEFLARARGLVPLRVVSGDEEARLAWRSAESGLPPLLPGVFRSVLDIGGGSTELIIGCGGEKGPRQFQSVPIGSVRLTERLLHGDPPSDGERRALRAAVERALDDLPVPRGELVGVAGTVTTLAAMHLSLVEYDGRRVDGMRLPVPALSALVSRLGDLPLSERRRIPGLDPRRADVIYAGGVILLGVCDRAGVPDLIVSDRGVRWGALLDLADELASAGGDHP